MFARPFCVSGRVCVRVPRANAMKQAEHDATQPANRLSARQTSARAMPRCPVPRGPVLQAPQALIRVRFHGLAAGGDAVGRDETGRAVFAPARRLVTSPWSRSSANTKATRMVVWRNWKPRRRRALSRPVPSTPGPFQRGPPRSPTLWSRPIPAVLAARNPMVFALPATRAWPVAAASGSIWNTPLSWKPSVTW